MCLLVEILNNKIYFLRVRSLCNNWSFFLDINIVIIENIIIIINKIVIYFI